MKFILSSTPYKENLGNPQTQRKNKVKPVKRNVLISSSSNVIKEDPRSTKPTTSKITVAQNENVEIEHNETD